MTASNIELYTDATPNGIKVSICLEFLKLVRPCSERLRGCGYKLTIS